MFSLVFISMLNTCYKLHNINYVVKYLNNTQISKKYVECKA